MRMLHSTAQNASSTITARKSANIWRFTAISLHRASAPVCCKRRMHNRNNPHRKKCRVGQRAFALFPPIKPMSLRYGMSTNILCEIFYKRRKIFANFNMKSFLLHHKQTDVLICPKIVYIIIVVKLFYIENLLLYWAWLCVGRVAQDEQVRFLYLSRCFCLCKWFYCFWSDANIKTIKYSSSGGYLSMWLWRFSCC